MERINGEWQIGKMTVKGSGIRSGLELFPEDQLSDTTAWLRSQDTSLRLSLTDTDELIRYLTMARDNMLRRYLAEGREYRIKLKCRQCWAETYRLVSATLSEERMIREAERDHNDVCRSVLGLELQRRDMVQ